MNQTTNFSQELIPPVDYLGQSLGIQVRRATGNQSIRCPFHNDRSPSLNMDMTTGRFHCFGCGVGGGDLIDFHRRLTGCGFQQALAELGSVVIPNFPRRRHDGAPVQANSSMIEFMNKVWDEGTQATAGDHVDLYLSSRGLQLKTFPDSLRLHQALKYKHEDIDYGFFPAMIAKVEQANGEMVCVHRTYLAADGGGKADVPKPKKLMPCAVSGATRGAAIRLFPATQQLALAEGIETALAFSQLTGINSWAAVSAGGLENIQLPTEVTDVIICVDVDRKGRGEKSANILAERLITEGRKVQKAIPPGELLAGQKSKDWQDSLEEILANQIGTVVEKKRNSNEQY